MIDVRDQDSLNAALANAWREIVIGDVYTAREGLELHNVSPTARIRTVNDHLSVDFRVSGGSRVEVVTTGRGKAMFTVYDTSRLRIRAVGCSYPLISVRQNARLSLILEGTARGIARCHDDSRTFARSTSGSTLGVACFDTACMAARLVDKGYGNFAMNGRGSLRLTARARAKFRLDCQNTETARVAVSDAARGRVHGWRGGVVRLRASRTFRGRLDLRGHAQYHCAGRLFLQADSTAHCLLAGGSMLIIGGVQSREATA